MQKKMDIFMMNRREIMELVLLLGILFGDNVTPRCYEDLMPALAVDVEMRLGCCFVYSKTPQDLDERLDKMV